MSDERRFGGLLRRQGARSQPVYPGEVGIQPDAVSGITFWGQTYDGSKWPDSSTGSGTNLVAGVAPGSGTINGITVADYNGSSHYLQGSAGANYISASGYHCFVVANADALGNASSSFFNEPPLLVTFGGRFAMAFGSTGYTTSHFDGSFKNTTQIAVSTGTTYVFEASFNGTTVTSKVNGSGTQTVAAGNISGTMGVMRSGVRDGTDYYNGQICEIVTYNTQLSTADSTGVRQYLANRWGVTL